MISTYSFYWEDAIALYLYILVPNETLVGGVQLTWNRNLIETTKFTDYIACGLGITGAYYSCILTIQCDYLLV